MNDVDLLSHAEYMELEGADPRRKRGRLVLGRRWDLLELVFLVVVLIAISIWVLIGLAIASLV